MARKSPLPDTPEAYPAELEKIEIELLLEGGYRHYGFDVRPYAYASRKRRLWKRIQGERLERASQLQQLVLHDEAASERRLMDLPVKVTAMFRDRRFYKAFHLQVGPPLRTYPFSRLSH